jgi:hypothetical protein
MVFFSSGFTFNREKHETHEKKTTAKGRKGGEKGCLEPKLSCPQDHRYDVHFAVEFYKSNIAEWADNRVSITPARSIKSSGAAPPNPQKHPFLKPLHALFQPPPKKLTHRTEGSMRVDAKNPTRRRPNKGCSYQ